MAIREKKENEGVEIINTLKETAPFKFSEIQNAQRPKFNDRPTSWELARFLGSVEEVAQVTKRGI